MEKLKYIYKTTNFINGIIYIGQHVSNNTKYFGSGKLLKESIKEFGIENFKNEILEYCSTNEELNVREKFWIKHFNSVDKNIGYNISSGGGKPYRKDTTIITVAINEQMNNILNEIVTNKSYYIEKLIYNDLKSKNLNLYINKIKPE